MLNSQEAVLLPDSPRLTTNNFDLLRLLFAGTVCLVHAYQLSEYQPLAWIDSVLSTRVAVEAFFVVSGFLIFMSYERSSSNTTYASKRIRRIYPAYFVAVMLCAVGLLGVSSNSVTDYFTVSWVGYVVANLSFLNFFQHTLPGVFETNPVNTVNGALWTLKIEVMFYLSVPLFVMLFRRFGTLAVLAIAYVGSISYVVLFAWLAEKTGDSVYLRLGRQLPGQLSFFCAGAFFYYQLKFFERWAGYFLAGAILVLIFDSYWLFPLFEPFALATVVIFFALFFYLGNFGKYGDFSYGIYILHFPVLQVFVHYGWLADDPWLYLAAGALTTLVMAVAMWHLVEKRFLLRSSHYVSASRSPVEKGGDPK
ncbi:acyltransferase [Marinihelvus fidelis]|uniref:Acyltransferase n=1 Tax=Marinihelvus fidelis TaxID=2613842 RepID=A0A5N0TCL0_9GAMM|nr:acyltransferase [Marinihelvus fidelis]